MSQAVEAERAPFDAKPLSADEYHALLEEHPELVLRTSDGDGDNTFRFWIEDDDLYWRCLNWTAAKPADLVDLEVELEDSDVTVQLLVEGALDDGKVSWEEAQERVREFADGEVRALAPMAGEMVVLYDDGRYGPGSLGSNPPNVELITKADSIWDCWTDDGSMSFKSIVEKYDVEVLQEVDLSSHQSDANAKAYVGVPKHQIRDGDES